MSEVIYERIKKNLEILNMKNTSLILDNYLEKAIHDKKNIVEVLDYLHWNSSILIFSQA